MSGSSEQISATLNAKRLYDLGNMAGCIAALDVQPNAYEHAENIILKARAMLRMQRIAEVETWLNSKKSILRDPDDLATLQMTIGFCRASVADFSGALALFAIAGKLAKSMAVKANIAYYRGLALFSAKSYEMATAALQPAFDLPDEGIYVYARHLAGMVAICENNGEEALLHLQEALSSIDRCGSTNAALKAAIVQHLVILAAEELPGNVSDLDALVETVQWEPSLLGPKAETLRYVGLAYERAGDLSTAIHRYIQASRTVPGSAWQVMSAAQCSDVLGRKNESLAAEGYLFTAVTVADDLDWSLADGDELLALLVLAMALARNGDPERSAHYLRVYHDNKKPVDRLNLMFHNDRLTYLEEHADAVVRSANDDAAAHAILSSVERRWQSLNYAFRGAEATWDRERIELREHFPKPASTEENGTSESTTVMRPSDIGKELTPEELAAAAAATTNVPIRVGYVTVKLTARQDSILRSVVRGLDNAQIARVLDISANTVRTYLSELYMIFQVRNQRELIALCLTDELLRVRFDTSRLVIPADLNRPPAQLRSSGS